MLSNLKAELVRKGLDPIKCISDCLHCTNRTARDKLNGKSVFTIPEARKIILDFFDSEFTVEYLFFPTAKNA